MNQPHPVATNDVCIVMPVYNEASAIEGTIREINKAGYRNIIVVDDGSTDNTQQILKLLPVTAYHHRINRGKGAAVKTGIEAAKRDRASYVATIDGDGQHNPHDIHEMRKAMTEGYYDVILGSRLIHPPVGMPVWKQAANRFANLLTLLFYGLHVSDSQSGFRLYGPKALQLIDTKHDKYEFDTEVIWQIKKHNLTFHEIPIEVRYTKYSQEKAQKQSLANGFKTMFSLTFEL